jgi:hypothetical protein
MMSKNIKIYGFRPYAEPIIKTGKSFKYGAEFEMSLEEFLEKINLNEDDICTEIKYGCFYTNKKDRDAFMEDEINSFVKEKTNE